MKKPFLIILILTIFGALAISPAMARGGFRIPGIQTQKIEMVLDLPDTPTFQREDKYVDIGYLHQVWGEGKWVGYVGNSSEYLALEEAQFLMILAAAGVSELPSEPEKPLSIKIFEWASILVPLYLLFIIIMRSRRAQKNESLPSVNGLDVATKPSPVNLSGSRSSKGFGRRT